MSWDDDPQVISPWGRSIGELLEPRPRRQALTGFEDCYSDIVDYIVRCTHRIWEEKNVGLCRTHYAADCPVLTLGGRSAGSDAVVAATIGALASHPDRSPITEDVIWSEDRPGEFLSSHRIVSFASHLGPDVALGLPTGRRRGVRVIADCLVAENQIIDEWLVRDNLALARDLGLDAEALVRQAAMADRSGDPSRHDWLRGERDRVRGSSSVAVASDHPAAPIVHALDLAFNRDMFGDASAIVAASVETLWASGRHSFGRGGWIGTVMQVAAPLADRRMVVDHVAARPLPDGEIAVALRWWLVGRHAAVGVWGAPTGRELALMAISHYRVRGGRMIEDITIFDELALLRQIEGGLGA